MTTGMLQETIPSVPTGLGPKFRPYASPNHHVTKGRYITSNDPRGYIPVYEYPLNGQWIMMDIDDGYILWTGIWKALGNSKADIVKMIDSQPELAPVIRRVRGGYLKIQGTWMPYEVALRLSRRVAWPIREDLVPLFGPKFPSTCLSPNQPGYGQVVASAPGRRRSRRQTQATSSSSSQLPSPTVGHPAWSVITQEGVHPSDPRLSLPHPMQSPFSPPQFAPFSAHPESQGPHHNHHHHHQGYGYQQEVGLSADKNSLPLSLPPPVNQSRERGYSRYSPYPGYSPPPLSGKQPMRRASDSVDMHSLSIRSPTSAHSAGLHDNIVLPPITPIVSNRSVSANESSTPYALPPISALEDLRGINANDSAAVLRRLQCQDEDDKGSDSSRLFNSLPRMPSSVPARASSAVPQMLAAPRLSTPSVHSLHSHSSVESFRDSRLSVSVPSDTSHGSLSSHPSPVSPPSPSTPATPQSAFREGLVPLSVLAEHSAAKQLSGPGNPPSCVNLAAYASGGGGGFYPTSRPGHLYERGALLSDCREVQADANDGPHLAKMFPLSRRERDDSNHGVGMVRLPHRPW